MITITAAEYRALRNVPKQNKYRAIRTVLDGFTFDSKAEAARYGLLKMWERSRIIERLEVHPRFELFVNGEHAGWYTGDFGYINVIDGIYILEDVKSPATRRRQDYRIRKRLMRICHGIDITEVMS